MSQNERYPFPEGVLELGFSHQELCPWAPLLIPETSHVEVKRTHLYKILATLESLGEVRILSSLGEWRYSQKGAPVMLTRLLNRLIAQLLPPATLQAALVGNSERALLLVGRSGSGKTTLARALLELGYQVGSDEFVCLKKEGVVAFPRALEYEDLPPAGPGRSFEYPEYEYKLWQSFVPPLLSVPYTSLKALLYLEPDRVGPYLLPLSRLPDRVWVKPPRWSQFFPLYQLFRTPIYSLYPGEVEETQRLLVTLLA